MAIDTMEKCRLESEKRWNKFGIELQKVRDDVDNIINSDLRTMEARLNKQAAMVDQIQQISLNVASLTQNMQGMLDELKKQNDRISQMEQKPIKRWDSILDTIIKVVLTAALGVILYKVGLQ